MLQPVQANYNDDDDVQWFNVQ